MLLLLCCDRETERLVQSQTDWDDSRCTERETLSNEKHTQLHYFVFKNTKKAGTYRISLVIFLQFYLYSTFHTLRQFKNRF